MTTQIQKEWRSSLDKQPLLDVEDLALMLEMDLHLGRRPDFVRRLRKALAAMQTLYDADKALD